ncbi:diguanylate cyclase [Desulfosoma sp.]
MEAFRQVLIVEDSPTQALRLQAVLESLGYGVHHAANGQKALEVLEKTFCPVVITDWVMPEMDGLTFCRAVRSRPYPGYVYVILLTARDTLNDIVAGLEAGADDYLVKPVHPSELAARLKTARRILQLEATLKKRTEEVARLSVTDPLTQLYNRRYFNEQLPKLLQAGRRHQRPVSLIMTDIDHFKKINDTYGHQTGDHVLQAFAAQIQGSLRAGLDWAARFGGEEFIVVLPETDVERAGIVAERLRLLVAQTAVPSAKGPVRITASFGVSGTASGAEWEISMEVLVAAADAALYRAKENGRNRTEIENLSLSVQEPASPMMASMMS